MSVNGRQSIDSALPFYIEPVMILHRNGAASTNVPIPGLAITDHRRCHVLGLQQLTELTGRRGDNYM